MVEGIATADGGPERVSSPRGAVERVVVRRGAFHDPLVLMQASEAARAVPGVEHVAVGMAEPLNMVILTQRFGYEFAADGLGPNDLVIGLRSVTEDAADEALGVIERCLAARLGEREVVDVGAYVFAGDRDGHPVERVRWQVAEPGLHRELLERLAPRAEAIAAANDEAVARMQAAQPLVVGVATARDVLPGMTHRTILHAGPPIDWADMSGPLRGAVIGAALLEGLADDPDDAVRRAEAGEFEFAPGHERGALGPMAGVISASMPLWVIENASRGNRAHCTFSEGLGGPFRFGAYDADVIDRLRWIRAVLAPLIAAALERMPAPPDLRAISADAVQMGDEVHNRNAAANAQFLRALAPALLQTDASSQDARAAADHIADDPGFYLNLSMASGKA
ncbi:MAG: hypothetical protein QOF29_3605, partial [bacterium]